MRYETLFPYKVKAEFTKTDGSIEVVNLHNRRNKRSVLLTAHHLTDYVTRRNDYVSVVVKCTNVETQNQTVFEIANPITIA